MADTTIESTKYNANVADVETDLNAPRPIVAGGTGANNAVDAANNLGVVTGKGAQAFTEAEKAVARNNIAAAPFDAMAYNGMQVNGSMEVSQELGTSGTTTSGKYVCDGWIIASTTAFGSSQAGAPGIPGFSNHLTLNIATALPTLAAGDYVQFLHTIEGYRLARLGWGTSGAQPITIAFWTVHSVVGIYSVVASTPSGSRSYVATYTQAVSNGGQYNVITIPGDTVGSWPAGNAAGLVLHFTIAAGSTHIAPSANTWHAGNYAAAPGQVNGAAAASNQFRFVGVIVLPGAQAPSAAQSPTIMRPYDQELVTCQRYWQQRNISLDVTGNAGSVVAQSIDISPNMRTVPTMTLGTPYFAPSNLSTPVATGSGSNQLFAYTVQATLSATGRGYHYAYVVFDARL